VVPVQSCAVVDALKTGPSFAFLHTDVAGVHTDTSSTKRNRVTDRDGDGTGFGSLRVQGLMSLGTCFLSQGGVLHMCSPVRGPRTQTREGRWFYTTIAMTGTTETTKTEMELNRRKKDGGHRRTTAIAGVERNILTRMDAAWTGTFGLWSLKRKKKKKKDSCCDDYYS